MKWETYKQLTPEQKEEWKFKYDKEIDPPFMPTDLIILLCVNSTFFTLAFVLLKELPEKAHMINDIFDVCFRFTIIWFVAMVGFAICWCFKNFRRIRNEKKWLNKIGVKK